jgi:undecaprenyl-diphosphatase
MTVLEIIVLAIVQGLTEFLPISSAAHLILVPLMTPWDDQGLGFDLAVHAGTLTAVIVYFRRDVYSISRDTFASLATRRMDGDARLGWWVTIATIPVGLAGLTFKGLIETTLRTPEVGAVVMAFALIGFGLLLGLADWRFRGERSERDLRLFDALFIGFAQALALIPGTSRSGITITAGLFLGLSREAAARFSFLMSIPVIVLASGLMLVDMVRDGAATDWTAFGLGAVVAGISAFLCIHYFLVFISRIGMQPFVVYRVVLGVILLMLFL